MTDPCANRQAPDPEAPPCETQRVCLADERERALLARIATLETALEAEVVRGKVALARERARCGDCRDARHNQRPLYRLDRESGERAD